MFDYRVSVRALTTAKMSETVGGLRKRLLGEAEDVEHLIKHKSLRGDNSETDSSDTSSSSSSSSSESTLQSSDDEKATPDVTSSADVQIPFDPLQLYSRVDAWKC